MEIVEGKPPVASGEASRGEYIMSTLMKNCAKRAEF